MLTLGGQEEVQHIIFYDREIFVLTEKGEETNFYI